MSFTVRPFHFTFGLRDYAAANEKELDQVAYALETLSKDSPKKDFDFRPAEELYRELVRRAGKADSHLKYAGFLGRRGRHPEVDCGGLSRRGLARYGGLRAQGTRRRSGAGWRRLAVGLAGD